MSTLSARSERFRELRARADVGFRRAGTSHKRQPLVGELLLRRNRFDIPDSGEQRLQVYHAEPGSPSAERLAALRSSLTRASVDVESE